MNRIANILICDDDPIFQLNIKRSFKNKYEFRTAYHGDEALAIIKNHPIDVLVLDLQMRDSKEGLRFIPKFLEVDPDLTIIMASSVTDFRIVREAMKLGVIDYLAKDSNPDELEHVLQKALERRALLQLQEQRNFEILSSLHHPILIGKSPQIRHLKKILEKIKNSPANVIITGETGTGKELVARQLRGYLADSSPAPFLAVDSSTIQSTMAESLLFGHEKGAFTGAEKTTKGIFEEADGGVVYFDEIANMPLEIQAKLLRVLQEKEIKRLGSSKVIQLQFRVICASNQDLEKMVRDGTFKADLLQRLNVIPIYLPPLRERTEDISLLVEYFSTKQSPAGSYIHFTPAAIEVLQNYSWPGNVRELNNLIAYLTTMTEGSEIDIADLPPKFRDKANFISSPQLKNGHLESHYSFYEKVSKFERDLLKKEYDDQNGNITQLALTLGMDRSHLYSKLREHGIHATRRGKNFSEPHELATPESAKLEKANN